MQSAEEFAAQMGSALWNGDDAADLIRARDAEVAEQVRAEFEDMEHRLSVLLCNLTGGLLSKTGYDVATMEQHIEDYFEREVVEPARAEARAETLAGFIEERTDRMVARRVPCDCPGDWQHHGRFVGDDGPETHVSFVAVPSRRLVSPWEPAP